MKEGEFAYDWKRDGWVFADYYKTGITFQTCPFCGGDLPNASSILDALTDGSEGDEA